MHKARQVYCLGQGGSMYIANDICARFACISTKFRTAGDSHMQLITASLMTPEDVVLFVSYSGATRDMLETLRAAKAAGAKIILLTHYEDSPGAKLADIVLLCGAQESPLDSGNIPVKVALLYEWLKCWCCATPWTTPKMPTPHRIAPVKHWRSKCCKILPARPLQKPVFCGGLGISGKGCVKSVSDLFQKKIDLIFSMKSIFL